MTARAAAAEGTSERILKTAGELFGELLYDQVSLDLIAVRARVTVRTVIRRFRSKEQLFAGVASRRAASIRAGRAQALAGDVAGAVQNLVAGYEEWGDSTLNFLAQERRAPIIGAAVRSGRDYHQAWVERILGPLLPSQPRTLRRRRLAELMAVTDVYAWKVLRRDLGLSVREVERALVELIERVTGNKQDGAAEE
jgi:AcrR family transcriptional regulator